MTLIFRDASVRLHRRSVFLLTMLIFTIAATLPLQAQTAITATGGDTKMQYMLLIYNDPKVEPAYGTPEFEAMMGGFFALSERMKADNVLVSGEGLQGVETATSVRTRGGKVETMDGPFAETREHLGGYYVIEVPDLDSALRYAAMVPPVAWGTVEVRPLMTYNPGGE
ncbi:YciI family protein [Sinorhizobium sp. A49]|uniref:YciI family protein n=1 Tax=Sinorhizobium sp. A49 TaxID=1945861 RepID=UPI001FD8A98A|nr:YciI family protein [Sinorhizobium sp. A49]